MPVEQKIKKILNPVETTVPTAEADFSSTENTEIPADLSESLPVPQVAEEVPPISQPASTLLSSNSNQQKSPEVEAPSSPMAVPDLPVPRLQTPETNPLASMLKATFPSHPYQTQAIANELPLSATVNNRTPSKVVTI